MNNIEHNNQEIFKALFLLLAYWFDENAWYINF